MKADLHVHSCYSDDGQSTPEQIVESALNNGIGCVAVSDHNEWKAFFDLEKDGRIIAVPAEEVSSSEGHILAYGISSRIEQGLSIKETIDAIHEAGGIAIAAHPYRWVTGIGPKNVIDDFDGVEAFNARSMARDNFKSTRLAKGFGKIITAGSDAHSPGHIGEAYVEIPDTCRTWQDVMTALKEGNVIVGGRSRTIIGSIRYAVRTLSHWTFRGFRRI